MSVAKWALLVVSALIPTQAFAEHHADDPKAQLVHEFLAAFNAQDAERMGDLVTEDIQWLSVAGPVISIEVEGRSSLVAAMSAYFSSCPSCRSTISQMMPSHDRVCVVEIATWESDGGRRSQQAMAVYEFSGPKIAAVYYFPAEPVSASESESGAE